MKPISDNLTPKKLMGVFSKSKETSPNGNGEINNIISQGTVITGDIESKGNFRLEGKLKGNIITKAKLFVGKTGEVNGNIDAENAVIEGQVKGDLVITADLVLKETADIVGNIKACHLTTEKGGNISGQVQVSSKTTADSAPTEKLDNLMPKSKSGNRRYAKNVA